MKYIVMVICHNELQHLKLYKTKSEASFRAILQANLWYKKEGVKEFKADGISSLQDMQDYYLSDAYFNSEDNANVIIKKLAA